MKFITAICFLLSFSAFANISIKFGTIAPAGTPWADSLEQIKNRKLKIVSLKSQEIK
jgi:hypothetical protein